MKTKRTNRFLSILLTLVMVVGMLLITAFAIPPASAAWDGSTTDSDWEGGGTQQDPYLISSAEELAGMAAAINGNQYRDQHFKLTADIDLGNQPWTPIGTWSGSSRAFEGTFNGDGYRITGLNVSGNVHYAGLFGLIEGARILNVEVYGSVSTTFMNEGYVGGIVGYSSLSSYIANCASGVNVSGQNAGGIVGYFGSSSSYLVNCYSTGTVTSSLDEHGQGKAGGIVGAHSGTIVNCYSISSVGGGAQNGIISGYNNGGTINLGYYLKDGDAAACGHIGGSTTAYYFTAADSNVFAVEGDTDQEKNLVTALNENRGRLESILGSLGVVSTEWVVNDSVNNGYPVFATNSDLPEVTPYQIWVNGTQITSENAGNVLGDETVSYHASTNTLTLNGAAISAGAVKSVNGVDMNCGIYVDTEDSQGINIHLTGTNAINLSAGTDYTCGIGVEAGSGSLALTAEEGASLDVNATNRGIFAYDGIHISGGTYTLTVDNGATWTNPAIESHGDSVIENADVTAASSGENAINATALEIRSGTVSAKGKYDGIRVTDDLTIANSTVTAVGGDNGIRSSRGTITLSGENTVVTAESKSELDTESYNSGLAIKGGSTRDEDTYAMPITLNDGLGVTEPTGGTIDTFTDKFGQAFYCVLNADGTPTNKAVIKAHSHCVCGGKDNVSNHTHSESVKYQPWDGTTALEGGNNYYLTQDATVDSVTISGVKGVNLCLNGHTLNSSLKINDNLNICDCGEDGKITSSDAAVISYQNPDYSDSVSLYSGSLIGTGGNETVQGNDNTGNAFYFYGGTVSHTGDLIPFIGSGKIYFYGGTVNSNSHGAADERN